MELRFTVNGAPRVLTHVDPHQSVLGWLRSEGLTGTKDGCAEGECGACTVALVTRGSEGAARYEAVNSCLLPLGALHGQHLITVEGVAEADGTLHPVQSALVAQAGSQCGYCTPGFVMSLFCEYYRPSRGEYDSEAISGNLCRCTGYRPIADAARSLGAPTPTDRHLRVLRNSPPPLARIEYSCGETRFLRPTTLAELFEEWARFPEAVLISGGTDLMVYANQHEPRSGTFISLEALAELSRVDCGDHEIEIGAGVKLSSLKAWCDGHSSCGVTIFHELLPLFSSRLIRNRATIGGNLGTASPIGDLSPVLLALDAELLLGTASSTRRVPLSEFFLGYRKTLLAPGELILSAHLPRPLPRHQRFYKVSKRVLDDISAVAAAFTLDQDESGRIQRLRMAFGGIAATPVRAASLELAAKGRRWDEDTVAWLAAELETLGTPLSDHRASAGYRRAMLGSLIAKFFADTSRPEAAA